MRLSEGLFVTGTGTGVGKTVVTGALAAALASAGVSVRALKPVASGVEEEPGEDACFLAEWAGHLAESAVSLKAPLSPHRAAILEGRTLDAAEILRWIEARKGTVTLVEGVGGWEVPILPQWRVSAMAEALGFPVLVVASDQLGVLSNVLLTVEAIRTRKLVVAGVVLSTLQPDASTAWNIHDLRMLLPDVPVRRFPYLPDLSAERIRGAGRALLREEALDSVLRT